MSRFSRGVFFCAIGLGFFALQFISTKAGEAEATPQVVQLKEFSVMGYKIRTNNPREATKDGQIAPLWDRVRRDNLLSKIPHRLDANAIVVYSNFDKDASYDYLIGAKVGKNSPAPQGMVVIEVPAGRFALFTSEKGPVAKVVIETWQHILALPKSEPGGQRAYKADFEVYDQRAADPQNSQVDIYIGIR
ncbi:MAG TPA: GyrI-like domain-containing protein [Candidatus Acidoferrales bacterium]|jgi:predicted transcriptional regulator YdeE|nr:GyrI-like domain-containing protein [Candidatus Acidoferrales bacterium]